MSINFNKKLYTLKAIKSAIKAYKGLAKFSLKDKKKYIIVDLKNIDKDVQPVIKDEFCNYVLAELRS